MSKQISAVEWLYEQLTEVDYGCINKTFLQNNNSLAGHKLRELFEQAKQMEKEQIMNAFIFSKDPFGLSVGNSHTIKKAEQYYEQTFKSE